MPETPPDAAQSHSTVGFSLFFTLGLLLFAANAWGQGSYFVALEVPRVLHPSFGAAQERLEASKVVAEWSRLANLHVTLYFCGTLDRVRLELFKRRLRRVAVRHAPFSLEYRGIGSFPFRGSTQPRVLFGQCEGSLSALDGLAAAVETCARELGLRRRSFPFNPHVTLARVRELPPGNALATAMDGLATTSFGHHMVGEFVLLQSVWTEDGGRYEAVERYRL